MLSRRLLSLYQKHRSRAYNELTPLSAAQHPVETLSDVSFEMSAAQSARSPSILPLPPGCSWTSSLTTLSQAYEQPFAPLLASSRGILAREQGHPSVSLALCLLARWHSSIRSTSPALPRSYRKAAVTIVSPMSTCSTLRLLPKRGCKVSGNGFTCCSAPNSDRFEGQSERSECGENVCSSVEESSD